MWSYGPQTLLTVTDPQLLKQLLLNNNGIITKGSAQLKKLSPLLGKGLLTTVGEEWALHRRIVSPAFHHDRIKVQRTVQIPCALDSLPCVSSWLQLY